MDWEKIKMGVLPETGVFGRGGFSRGMRRLRFSDRRAKLALKPQLHCQMEFVGELLIYKAVLDNLTK